MSRHVMCSALVVATLTLAACSSACVQTQDEHSPAAHALADLRATAEAGDAAAQFILGGMYVTGVGVPQDAAEAAAWSRARAVQPRGDVRRATGCRRAVAWYRRAAEAGGGAEQPDVPRAGVPRRAVAWYRRAAGRATRARSTTSGACMPRASVCHRMPSRPSCG